MTSALAVAGVTAVIKDLLDNRLVEQGVTSIVGDVVVTTLPPDRITVGSDERAQLNLFLYRVTPRTGWRRSDGGAANGPATSERRLPLMLDLHYLLTAYGQQDLQAEILLGHAIQLLHETPVLTRETIQAALNGSTGDGSDGSGTATRTALASSSLAEQVEEITIDPEFLSMEEVSKLWSALQAHYRPSAAYKVSAVAIDAGGVG